MRFLVDANILLRSSLEVWPSVNLLRQLGLAERS